MSFPNIPDITPEISLTREDVINLLLASISLEELGLAHLINAESEKIQHVIGTDSGQKVPIGDLKDINQSVNKTLKDIIKLQMLLQFKLEDVISLTSSTSSTTTTTTSTTTTTTTSTRTTTTTTTKTTTSTTTTRTTTTKKHCPCNTKWFTEGCFPKDIHFTIKLR